jgi:hypothetical protein
MGSLRTLRTQAIEESKRIKALRSNLRYHLHLYCKELKLQYPTSDPQMYQAPGLIQIRLNVPGEMWSQIVYEETWTVEYFENGECMECDLREIFRA